MGLPPVKLSSWPDTDVARVASAIPSESPPKSLGTGICRAKTRSLSLRLCHFAHAASGHQSRLGGLDRRTVSVTDMAAFTASPLQEDGWRCDEPGREHVDDDQSGASGDHGVGWRAALVRGARGRGAHRHPAWCMRQSRGRLLSQGPVRMVSIDPPQLPQS